MNRFFKSLLLVATLAMASAPALGYFQQTDINNENDGNSNSKHTRDYGYKYGVAKCYFDPSLTSGSRSIAPHGCGLFLPAGAVVKAAYYKVLTTFTSASDAATIAIHLVAANDIVSAAAISTGTTWDATSQPIEAVPKTETSTTWLVTTAKSEVTFTVAIEALTAGKLVLWVEYLYHGDSADF